VSQDLLFLPTSPVFPRGRCSIRAVGITPARGRRVPCWSQRFAHQHTLPNLLSILVSVPCRALYDPFSLRYVPVGGVSGTRPSGDEAWQRRSPSLLVPHPTLRSLHQGPTSLHATASPNPHSKWGAARSNERGIEKPCCLPLQPFPSVPSTPSLWESDVRGAISTHAVPGALGTPRLLEARLFTGWARLMSLIPWLQSLDHCLFVAIDS
jgi:hypothetical protein